jgi:hypothetical protein
MDGTSIIISLTTIGLSALVLGIVYAAMYCLNRDVNKTNR